MAQPTMADIAEHVGVSRPLVSIVLRGAPGASDRTRARVLAAARELGYTPHQGARTLRRARSQHLGVTFAPVHASEPEIVEAVYEAAAERGYQVVLSAWTAGREEAEAVEELLGYRCAALVAIGSDLGHVRLAALARRAAVPVVLVGTGRLNRDYDVVGSDGALGVSSVVDHLADLGHRDVAYLHCPSLPSARERLRGFQETAERRGLRTTVQRVVGRGYEEEAGSTGARRLLALAERPTALVAGNDQQAVGALWVLTRAGVAVPREMSVAGYDDTRLARLSAVDLTTASQDTARLGRLAVGAALRRVDDPALPPTVTTVRPHLVTRSSTAAPRG